MSEREKDLVKLLVKKNENENEKRDNNRGLPGGGGGRGSYISSMSVFVASLILGFAITVPILAEGGCLLSRFHTGALSLLFE